MHSRRMGPMAALTLFTSKCIVSVVLLFALAACASTKSGQPASTSAVQADPRSSPEHAERSFCAYVTGFGSEEVCGLRIPGAERIGCIRTGKKPHGIALSRDGSLLYVSNEGENTVAVVGTMDMRVIATVAVGQRPNQIALVPDESALWVTNNGDHSVSVVDTESREVTRTFEVGRSPHIVVMDAARRQALVTSEGDGVVDVFDLGTFERTRRMTVYGFPRVLAVAPSGQRAFLTLRWLNGALVLDLEEGAVRERIALGQREFAEQGKDAHGVAVTHDGQFVLLTTQTNGHLTWIEAGGLSPAGHVRVGNDPNWVEVTPDDRFAVVSNTQDNTAVVVDVQQRRVVGRAAVSAQPKRLTVGACPGATLSHGGSLP